MAKIPQDVLSKLASLQPQIWSTVGTTASEAAGQAIGFADNPAVVATKTSALYTEINTPMMVVQFAFSSIPENPQVILIPEGSVIELLGLIQGVTVDEIDENVVSDLRGMLEGLVQGFCIGIGDIRSDMIVASGLTTRYQLFSFPLNLQRSEDVVRVQATMTGEGLTGSVLWLMDPDTAQFITGLSAIEAPASIGAPFTGSTGSSATVESFTGNLGEDQGNLEILMDVPLDVSVELGRTKMTVKDLLELSTGSVVEIERLAGEPVDVLINGRIVARGEVVVIEDNFGVRLTEILNPLDKARSNEAA